MLILIAFIIGLITDVVWATWTRYISEKRPLGAANISVMIYVCGLFYTLMIVDKQVTPVAAYLLGGWIGTYLTVWYSKEHK
jgi:tryptophan-rich sensory protein